MFFGLRLYRRPNFILACEGIRSYPLSRIEKSEPQFQSTVITAEVRGALFAMPAFVRCILQGQIDMGIDRDVCWFLGGQPREGRFLLICMMEKLATHRIKEVACHC